MFKLTFKGTLSVTQILLLTWDSG